MKVWKVERNFKIGEALLPQDIKNDDLFLLQNVGDYIYEPENVPDIIYIKGVMIRVTGRSYRNFCTLEGQINESGIGTPESFIPVREAPNDGKQYTRQNEEWQEINKDFAYEALPNAPFFEWPSAFRHSLTEESTVRFKPRAIAKDPDRPYLYAATHTNGRIGSRVTMNISDVSNPEIVGHYPSGTGSINVQDNVIYATSGYIYIGDNFGNLMIFDTSDPANLVLVDTITVGGQYFGMDGFGDYIATVQTGAGGFRVWDISDRENPQQIYQDTSLSVFAGVTFCEQDTIYASSYGSKKFRVYSLDTGTNTVSIEYTSGDLGYNPHHFYLSLDHDILGIIRYFGQNVKQFDISDRNNPVEINSYLLGNTVSTYGRIETSGRLACVSTLGMADGLFLIDILQDSPVKVTSLTPSDKLTGFNGDLPMHPLFVDNLMILPIERISDHEDVSIHRNPMSDANNLVELCLNITT